MIFFLMESLYLQRNWLVIAVLLPSVAFSILTLDIFWSVAAVASLIFLFSSRLPNSRPLQFPLMLALLFPFQPFALANLIGIDPQTQALAGTILQAWYIYFFSLAAIILVRDKLALRVQPGYTIFLAIMTSITLSASLGILSFFADRIFSTSLLPNNTYLMLHLLASFFASIFLGALSVWYVRRMEENCLETAARRPVQD